MLSAPEWQHIERGVIQRVTALNLLLDDLYHQQKILRDGVIPEDLILANPNFRPVMRGLAVRHKAYVNICGIDIIRDRDGTFKVLEDNARTPSGVSYVIENRPARCCAFSLPTFSTVSACAASTITGMQLGAAMREIAPEDCKDRRIVLLSPGIHNSAYFEHVFLAREMGVPLVEGRDLAPRTTAIFCARSAGCAGSTSSIAGSMTTSSTPRRSGPTASWGLPV